MMRIKTLALGLATVASVSLLMLPAQAADTNALTGNSVGEFEVAQGTLTLDAVPTFAFEGTTVKTLVTSGADLAYQNDAIKNGSTTGTKLTVSDYRGSDQPAWNLNAKMSPFTNKTSTITGTLAYATDNKAAGAVTGDNSSIWNDIDAGTAGVGTATAGTTTSTKLTLPKTSSVSTGTYDADLTWTLSATASD